MSDPTIPADTPMQPPATLMERVKVFIGDLARPWAIITTSTATAIAVVIGATKIATAEGGALYIGAVFAGLGLIYGAKSLENIRTAQAAAGTTTDRQA